MAFTDFLALGFLIFAVAIAVLISGVMFYTLQSENTYFNHTYTINGTSINAAEFVDNFYSIYDWFALFFVAVGVISLFVMGFLTPSHPIFAFIGLLMLVAWLFIAPYLSNAFYDLASMSLFSSVIARFPFTTAIGLNLPVLVFIVGVISNILFYGKSGGGGQPPYA